MLHVKLISIKISLRAHSVSQGLGETACHSAPKRTDTCVYDIGTFPFLIFTSAFSSKQTWTLLASLTNSLRCVCAYSPPGSDGNAPGLGGRLAISHLRQWGPRVCAAVRTLTGLPRPGNCCLRKIRPATCYRVSCPALGQAGTPWKGRKRRLRWGIDVWS